jgi:hypothetical protein
VAVTAVRRQLEHPASYIDVNSSVSPWWRTDMDASAAGAGTFAAFRDASAALWSFERTLPRFLVIGHEAHSGARSEIDGLAIFRKGLALIPGDPGFIWAPTVYGSPERFQTDRLAQIIVHSRV